MNGHEVTRQVHAARAPFRLLPPAGLLRSVPVLRRLPLLWRLACLPPRQPLPRPLASLLGGPLHRWRPLLWTLRLLTSSELFRSVPLERTIPALLLLSLTVSSAAFAGSLHPTFPLLDAAGTPVQESAGPVSPLRTCGSCHDTEFIAEHDSHSAAGAGLDCFLCHLPNPDDEARRAALASGREEWSATATLSRTGIVERASDVGTAGNSGTVGTAGTVGNSGTVGTVGTAGTAGNSGTVGTAGYRYLAAAFDENGHVLRDLLPLQDPTSDACGACHGAVHLDLSQPFVWPTMSPLAEPAWTSLRTGQIFSPQPIDESGLNLSGKSRLTRSWDVHAERGLDCVDCHYSSNNPIYRRIASPRPDHLRFDSRRIDLGDYLEHPSHVLAHGVEPGEDEGTMRSCATCHDASVGHDWLPYAERHFATLSCAACHIPELPAPALQSIDATVVTPDGSPRVELRGVEGAAAERWGFDLGTTTAGAFVRGYQPVLLPRREADGETRLAPHNLVTTYRWTEGDPPREIPASTISALLYDSTGRPRPALLEVFDRNGDQDWSEDELRLTKAEQRSRLETALSAAGMTSPQIEAVSVPYPITHGVTHGIWALRDCRQCHEAGGRIDQAVLLAGPSHPDVLPRMEADERIEIAGTTERGQNGDTRFHPTPRASLYVLGKHANVVVNRIGFFSMLLAVVGIAVHALLRAIRTRRPGILGKANANQGDRTGPAGPGRQVAPLAPAGPHRPESKPAPVYMYSAYERFWHWLQAAAIALLLLTGLEVHFPGTLRLFGFNLAVRAHNVVALVVVVNAALAAFYHFASGEIRQFLPEPRGFFRGAILQVRHYLYGIFHGEPHPFEKRRGQKLNALQQVTYLAILNLLFPLQIGTGLLIWGAQRWGSVDSVFGGLGVLGPIHALGAWLFAAFLVVHVYLTTTGPTPATYVKAMVTGWEDETGTHGAHGAAGGHVGAGAHGAVGTSLPVGTHLTVEDRSHTITTTVEARS